MADKSVSDHLKIVVLGAGAGGGVPQWNCNCDVCRMARNGAGSVLPRTQSSLAVSADGNHWCVFNCSPDIRQQILSTPCLHPRDTLPAGRRDSPIHTVVLTNGDVDHIAGLLVLREKQPFQLFATTAILGVLDENPIFNVLDPAFVTRNILPLDKEIEIAPKLLVEAFAVPGKVALYLEDTARNADGELDIRSETENTIGLRISAAGSGKSFFYIPGCAEMTDGLKDRLRDAALVLFDGTVWENEEMIIHGVGQKTGERMGHMSMSGEKGSLAAFEDLNLARKIYVHINNTNRVLIEDSVEREMVERQGWGVGHDGMEITL